MAIPAPHTWALLSESNAQREAVLLPEETITLKVVFDNVRNCSMCSALVAAVIALTQSDRGSASTLPRWPWSLQVFAILLFLANAGCGDAYVTDNLASGYFAAVACRVSLEKVC